MRSCYRPLAAAALSMTLMSTGCQSLEARLSQTAEDSGVAQAKINLPAWPSRCRKPEPHTPIVAGAELRSLLRRERAALDRANQKALGCAAFYDNLRAKIK